MERIYPRHQVHVHVHLYVKAGIIHFSLLNFSNSNVATIGFLNTEIWPAFRVDD